MEFIGELNTTCVDSFDIQMNNFLLTRENVTNNDENCRANAFCEKQALTALNNECVMDLLSINNEYIIQNYHAMESKLKLTTGPLITTSTSLHPCAGNEEHEDADEYYGDSFSFGYVFPILIFVVFIALAIFVVIRKKKAKKNSLKKQTIEMTELTSDSEPIVDLEL